MNFWDSCVSLLVGSFKVVLFKSIKQYFPYSKVVCTPTDSSCFLYFAKIISLEIWTIWSLSYFKVVFNQLLDLSRFAIMDPGTLIMFI